MPKLAAFAEVRINGKQQIHVKRSREFDAVDEQIISPKREILCKQEFRSSARLLAVRRRHARVRAIDRTRDSRCRSRQ